MSTIESIQEDCAIHRRDFLGGAWARSCVQAAQGAKSTQDDGGVIGRCAGASILVHARPGRVPAIAQTLAAEGFEMAARDPTGRLVVVVPAPNAGAIVAALNAVAGIPGVLTATLINSSPGER